MKITKTLTWTDLLVRIVLIVVLIAAGPLAFIWSLVTIRDVLIGTLSMWTLEAWFAALVLGATLGPKIQNKG